MFLGDILENPEMLQIQVMGASSCAYLYPDIGSSTVCYIAQARGPEINMVNRSALFSIVFFCQKMEGINIRNLVFFCHKKYMFSFKI